MKPHRFRFSYLVKMYSNKAQTFKHYPYLEEPNTNLFHRHSLWLNPYECITLTNNINIATNVTKKEAKMFKTRMKLLNL